jgi:hypothetical protein
MKTANIFIKHPQENNMTYAQHMRFALWLAVKTFGCTLASLVHAFFPFFFVTHTSKTIGNLNNVFINRNIIAKHHKKVKQIDCPVNNLITSEGRF